MLWNLFLAGMPLLFAFFILGAERLRWKKIFTLPLWLLWLFLFPNAPYMMTDLLHLQYLNVQFAETSPRVWFGYLHLCAGIAVGTCSGLLSLALLHHHIAKRYGQASGWAFAGAACFLSGIGIWIGRCMRFNTWDIWQDPWFLLRSALAQLNPRTILLCLLFAAMTAGAYLLLRCFLPLEETPLRRCGKRDKPFRKGA
jgi:uncharacterized membrane protein